MENTRNHWLQICRPFLSGQWGVKQVGSHDWLGVFDSRSQALAFAVNYSQSRVDIFIHDFYGRVEERLKAAA